MPASNRACQICSNPFYASPGHIRQGWGKFCSIACRTVAHQGSEHPSWRGGPTACICKRCGQTFYVKPSHILKGEGQYCSQACHWATKSKQIICQQCGVTFSVPNAWLRKGNVICCSNECRLIFISPKNNCICQECGQAFHRQPSDLARTDKVGVGRFCSMRCKARWMSHNARSSTTRRSRSGKREDLGGLYVRSSWEANYARYLNWLIEQGEIISWEYEPDTFEFEGIKRGTMFYTPDFKIVNRDGSVEYHEIKGWMDPKSRTKLKRMAKYHPDITLVLIDREPYYAIAKQVKNLIPHWEMA